jgi:predicted CXXCH cytochrome family protein
MKKITIIAVLTVALMFAFTSAAFASKGSVMARQGDTSTVSVIGTYNNWSGGGANDFGNTTVTAFPANTGSSSPHGGYATATVKCATCHAVHQAAPAGDTLLRVKASDACAYCHVATVANGGVGGAVVYGGDIAIANASGDDHHASGASANCSSYCHASVHGSDSVKDVPAVAGVLLKNIASTGGVDRPVQLLNMADLIDPSTGLSTQLATVNDAATRKAAIGIFCGSCHNGAYYVTGASQNVAFNYTTATATWSLQTGTAAKTGHRVGVTPSANWNAGGTISSSLKQTGAVAYAAAADCQSCHDASDGLTGNPGFPHYTPGAARFLTAAGFAGDTKTAVGAPTTADPNDVNPGGNLRAYTLKDGTCLKCHKGSATTGVGYDY